ncbi:adenylate/guanylate cyclase domain-containing protein [Geopsychrobacter electrodiphilus]|uniref:adenylate/guanylate cyclase domain-containing protein n=1 Tax=Geopsychrobacter electrodiphilus TaxID=225196 RepID=UPI000368B40A|nr:adenylate/guanylate cyclase domain-containing protein [Geopsychrobacter electrodiphilus]
MVDKIGFFSSLRFKFTLLMAMVIGFFILGGLFLTEQNMRRSLLRENIEKGVGVARAVAFNVEDPLLTGDDLYLFSAVKTAGRSQGVTYAVIVDDKDRVKAASDIGQVGMHWLWSGAAAPEEIGDGYLLRRNAEGSLLDVEVPILLVGDKPLQLGSIHLGLSQTHVNQAIAQMRGQLGLFSLLGILLSSAAAYLLASFFVRPVDALVQGVKAIGEGQFGQQILLQRKDELGVLTSAFNDMAASLREKEFIEKTFERYVSKPLAREILSHRHQLKLGGEEKVVTILFSDIRGFTGLAEGLSPSAVVELLNGYFSEMVKVIGRFEGMVDKFMGDAVLALFGAPITVGNEAMRAVCCALAMQAALQKFNQAGQKKGQQTLLAGIGINTGPVIAGNVGSAMRMEYTVIGDSVNVAARLQSIARAGEILISEQTYACVRDFVLVAACEPIQLKGKTTSCKVYRLEGLSGAGIELADRLVREETDVIDGVPPKVSAQNSLRG